MPNLSPDTVAQIIATVVIGVIAVVGSILGAIRGAEVGATATMEATTRAIAAQKRETQEQRLHEDRVLIRALASECRFNAITLRQEREYMPDPALWCRFDNRH